MKLTKLLKEALDASWNPYQSPLLKDNETIVFEVTMHTKHQEDTKYQFKGWSLKKGTAEETAEIVVDELKSDYISDWQANAGKYDDDDYDYEDIDVQVFPEESGYYVVYDYVSSYNRKKVYCIDNTYDHADDILKTLKAGVDSEATQLTAFML